MKWLIVGIISCAVASVGAAPLSEQEAVRLALTKSSDIRLVRLGHLSDSLSYREKLYGWYPTISLNASAQFSPRVNPVTGDVSVDANVAQSVPAGGRATASFTHDVSRKASDTSKSVLSFSFNQPLLKDAFRYGVQDWAVYQAKVDIHAKYLVFVQSVTRNISAIRKLWWDCYIAEMKITQAADDSAYQEMSMRATRVRFAVGSITPLDTLNGFLELLNAQSGLIAARTAAAANYRKLSRAIGIPVAESSVDTSVTYPLAMLPDRESFIKSVQEYDPAWRNLVSARELLKEQTGYAYNQLLPALSVGASMSLSKPQNPLLHVSLAYEVPNPRSLIALRRAQQIVDRNTLESANKQEDIGLAVDEVMDLWSSALRQIAIAQTAVAVAAASRASAEAGWRAGTVNYVEYVNSQNKYTIARINYLGQMAALRTVSINFDEISGAAAHQRESQIK